MPSFLFEQCAVTDFLGWYHFVLAAGATLLCVVLIWLAPHMPRLTGKRRARQTVQAIHTRPIPRVGGVAVFSVFAMSVAFAPAEIASTYAKFLLAASILFAAGLAEDLGFAVSPAKRLLAAVTASLAIMALLGIWLPRADIPGLDTLLGYWAVGVPVTLFITVSIAHAFNLIDGVNGLASLAAMVAATAMAMIAHRAGAPFMVSLATLMAATVFGFFLLNFPAGRIFLGDAGAYTLGFVLSWFGIALLVRAPEITPWAILLTLFWPAADIILAMFRRLRRKVEAMAPDRLHAHHMVMRSLEIYFLGRGRRNIANPLSTLILAPFVIAPPLTGVLLWNEPRLALAAVGFYGAVFFIGYVTAIPLLKRVAARSRPEFAGKGLPAKTPMATR